MPDRSTGTATIPLGGGQAAVQQAERSNPQLIDGQQRVFALYSIFAGHGYGRFYLNAFRDPLRGGDTFSGVDSTPVLDTEVEGFNECEAEPIADRDRYVDLSNWLSLGEHIDTEIDSSRVADVVSVLDTQFRLPEDATARTAIAARLESVRAAWRRKSIPMISALVRDPEDVLEVFSRVNRGGAPIGKRSRFGTRWRTFWAKACTVIAGMLAGRGSIK